jgi:hypothetical protein
MLIEIYYTLVILCGGAGLKIGYTNYKEYDKSCVIIIQYSLGGFLVGIISPLLFILFTIIQLYDYVIELITNVEENQELDDIIDQIR